MANHTYYLLPITYYLLPVTLLSPFSSQRGQGDKGTGGTSIFCPLPLGEGVYIFTHHHSCNTKLYKDFMFMRRELMFTALEYMFTVRELMFTARKHNFSRCKNTFFPMKIRLSRNYNTML